MLLVLPIIDKTQDNPECRMCHQANETVSHIASGCAKLAQAEYKRSHDNVARTVHWDLTRKCGFQRGDRWFEHVPESVLENDNYKLMWDCNIQTDHDIKARRPDMVVVNKREQTCQIIDVTNPVDTAVREKEKEKIEKYQNLAREVGKMWTPFRKMGDFIDDCRVNFIVACVH